MSNFLQTSIDHLVFGSYNLSDGATFINEHLGIIPEAGGQHITMGTHNKLLNLGHSVYLEVISINPDLPKPNHPRWFGMDKLHPNNKPQFITWVIRTNDIEKAVKKSPFRHGEIKILQRGNYKWQITLPADGSMPLQGLAPTIIQWHGNLHPIKNLSTPEISLLNIEVFHPEADILNDYLFSIGLHGAFNAITLNAEENPFLRVTLKSPKGIVVFET